MRAAIFHAPGRPLTIEDLPDPQPGPGELLVKVHRCGICGSDLSMTDAAASFTLPLGRIGHEYAGEVVEIGGGGGGGSAPNAGSFKVGDRVAVQPIAACGRCDGCRSGNAMFCTAGTMLHGGFGEYVAVPAQVAVKLPRSLSFGDGALIEPMACGLHALRMARIEPGERVLVLGAGTIALSAIYWARRLGAGRIVVLSRSPHRAEAVQVMGADAVVDFADPDPQAAEIALGGPPDIVAECVGKPGLLSRALELVRPQGTVLSMGMCMHADPVSPALCTFKEIRLLFPMAYTADEFAETARAFDAGLVRPETMVSDVIGLEELPGVLEALRGGRKSLKVHVAPAG